MIGRFVKFDLNLLTSQKELGLRQLRAFSASIGGQGYIFHNYNLLVEHLESSDLPQVIVLDTGFNLENSKIMDLNKLGQLFVIDSDSGIQLPSYDSGIWQSEGYLKCDIKGFFKSQVVHVCMANLIDKSQRFMFERTLNWGYAAMSWEAHSGTLIADTGLKFMRQFNLVTTMRRYTEMFCHFAEVRLPQINFVPQQIRFLSDGIKLAAYASCPTDKSIHVRDIIEELKMHMFPIGAINQRKDVIEIGIFVTQDLGLDEGYCETLYFDQRASQHQVLIQDNELKKVS
jgi:hypothetical protein